MKASRTMARSAVGVAVLLACLLLSACGGSNALTDTGKGVPAHGIASTRTGVSSTAGNGGPPPVASATEKAADGGTWQLSVYSLLRQGNHVVLYFGVKCLTPGGQIGCDGESFTATGSSEQSSTMNGLRLVDSADQRMYQVAQSGAQPVTSSLPGSLYDKKPRLEWAAFSAPPAGTSAIDVAFPDGGPVFSSVPITTGNAPQVKGMAVDQAGGSSKPLADLSAAGPSGFPLKLTVGNPYASDQETPSRSLLTLHSDVLFAFGKATLDQSARGVLTSVASAVKNRAQGVVHVDGYTDSKGSARINGPLSQRRAATVQKALKPLTPGVRYMVAGHGAADPVAPNKNPDGSDNPRGRAQNRRVTVGFKPKAGSKVQALSGAAARKAQTSATAMTFRLGVSGGYPDTYSVSGASLRREGGLALLRMSLKCVATAPQNTAGCSGGLTGDGETPPGQTAVGDEDSVGGFYLEDPVRGSVYDPARASGSPWQAAVTATLSTPAFNAGQQYPVWVYFPAIPASVSHLTLFAPLGKGKMTVPVTG